MKSFINGMRFVLKYGAYAIVIFDIIGYAIEKFEGLEKDKEKEANDK
jgi:hypothetical protein